MCIYPAIAIMFDHSPHGSLSGRKKLASQAKAVHLAAGGYTVAILCMCFKKLRGLAGVGKVFDLDGVRL